MNDEGKQMSAWLKRVTKDQNLNQLSEIENVPYDTRRQLFLSAQLSPDINIGWYDELTDRLKLGIQPPFPFGVFTSDANLSRSNSTTSLATNTLTPPAGHVYYVICANLYNGTDVASPVLYMTISGTAMYFNDNPAGINVAAAAVSSSLLGGACLNPLTGASGHVQGQGIAVPYGATISMTDRNFTAADNMRHQWIYYDITLR